MAEASTDVAGSGVLELVRRHLGVVASGWSIGTYGAIAEFQRDGDEPVAARADYMMATARGAIRVEPGEGAAVVEYESRGDCSDAPLRAVAFCLPAETAAMSARNTIAELGPDRGAVRSADREAVLFDIGVGAPHVDFCVRTRDPVLCAALRATVGLSAFAAGSTVLETIVRASPHRVAMSRLGRIEVFQPIAASTPGARTPEGPHTHVLPALLATGRHHGPSVPVPDGFFSCLELYPSTD